MALFSGRDHDNGSDFGLHTHDGDGALDALIILLLVAFTFALWFLCGAVRPMLADANPSLMAHPVPASGPYTAGAIPSNSQEPQR